MITRTSSASSVKKRTTCSGLPAKRRRSSSSCVAIPTGQVLRWQTRIMMQPSATSGAVEAPTSSAPSSAAITTSRPVRIPPSACSTTRERSPLRTSVCCVSASPSSHGTPADTSEDCGEAPVPPSWPAITMWSACAFTTPAATVPTPASAASFTRDARRRVRAAQVVDELLEVLDRVDVVVRRRRDQLDAGRRVAQRGRCWRRPCGPGSWPPSPGLAPCATLICSSSALTR